MRQYLLTACFFLLGVCFGSLLLPNIRMTNQTPVNADFCLLARNPELFESRRFMSYAVVTSAQPHGYVLVNPSCPREAMVFWDKLDRQDHVEELNPIFRDHENISIPVLFEATLYRPSLFENFWNAARQRLGLSTDYDRRIAIRAFNAVGEQEWDPEKQAWKPVSRPPRSVAGTGTQNTETATGQEKNLPDDVIKEFEIGPFADTYRISLRLQPLYLRGDFDGDSRPDYAIPIESISDHLKGIGIWLSTQKKIFVLGAGQPFAFGSSVEKDLNAIYMWEVYEKKAVKQGARAEPPPKLLGDALAVRKTGSASGLIYWDSKNFTWYEQGE